MASFTLVLVGGLNWGAMALFDYNFVNMLLGGYPTVERLVYLLVGLGAVYLLFTHKDDCCACSNGACAHMPGKKMKKGKKK